MLRTPILTLLICSITLLTSAQDSVKKPVVVKPPAIKPAVKYNTYNKYKYAAKKTTPLPVPANPAVQAAVPVRKDTVLAPTVNLDKSLNGQYQYLLTKVYRYQQPLIASLWKSALDTININKHRLQAAQGKLTTQGKTIDSLNTELATKDKSLQASNDRVDAVDLLGISVTKSAYNLIMWGLVLVFGITAIVVIARTGSYRREAKYRTDLYTELEEEYKTYKSKANEKEKKLARELQTERNKLDELLGRG